jgi:hypothetical protein
MTDEEKRQQKANLLLEYQEAEDHLAQLREKAHRKAQSFQTLHYWLKFVSGDSTAMHYGEDLSKVGDVIQARLADYRKQLDLDDVLALAAEIEQASKVLSELKIRKDKLGLR